MATTPRRRHGDSKLPQTDFALDAQDDGARVRAVRCVAAHARDAADAELLLDALGLSAAEAVS